MTLPLLAVGGVGVVGTSTHFTGTRTKQMLDAFAAGGMDEALTIFRAAASGLLGRFRHAGLHAGEGGP